jgi:hypothetical protein
MFAATKSADAPVLQQGRAAFVIRRQQRVASWLGRDIAAPRRRHYISNHEHSATFLSSQLISDSITDRSNHPLPQPIPTIPLSGEM